MTCVLRRTRTRCNPTMHYIYIYICVCVCVCGNLLVHYITKHHTPKTLKNCKLLFTNNAEDELQKRQENKEITLMADS